MNLVILMLHESVLKTFTNTINTIKYKLSEMLKNNLCLLLHINCFKKSLKI